jgi:hypothetical protein
MVVANILWNKLNSDYVWAFQEEYCKHNIPQELTLREVYLDECSWSVLGKIQENLKDTLIWDIMAEITDACGWYVANMLVEKWSKN